MAETTVTDSGSLDAGASPTLSVVIPVYNNASTIDQLISQTKEACHPKCGDAYEIILVEDGSSDESWTHIGRNAGPNVIGLRLSRNFGQHAALKAGFAHARGEVVIMMDADLEDPPEYIGPIFEELTGGNCDICFSRLTSMAGTGRRWTSKLFHRVSHRLDTHFALTDIGSMRGFSRRVRDAILRYGERRPVYGPLTTSIGFRHGVVDVPLSANKAAQSNYTFTKRLQLAVDYLIGYTNIPVQFFMIASLLSFIGTFSYAAIIIVQYMIIGSSLPPGISLLVVVVLLLFSVLFFGIGLIGVYVLRILHETLDRPLYVVAEVTEPDVERVSRNIVGQQDVRRD